jgi:hypothetical protein
MLKVRGRSATLSQDLSQDRVLGVGENLYGNNRVKGKIWRLRMVEPRFPYLIMPGPILPPIRRAMLNIR